VAVDLARPMPLSARENTWILVLTDHFTRWADALAIPDESAPTVARASDQYVFCYLGLPEQIHTDQGAQFQSQLMGDLCRIWGVNQSRTTPYHPQGNRVVEGNNRMLGDASKACSSVEVKKNGTWCCCKSCWPTAAHHTPAHRKPQTS